MLHLAVLHERYLDALLCGEKTVESRLTRTRREPWGCVRVGDVVLLKQRSGPVRARARVERVDQFEALTPARVRALRRTYDSLVCGNPEYWREKRHAKYATFLWLTRVCEVVERIETPRLHGRGWLVLGNDAGTARARAVAAAIPPAAASYTPRSVFRGARPCRT